MYQYIRNVTVLKKSISVKAVTAWKRNGFGGPNSSPTRTHVEVTEKVKLKLRSTVWEWETVVKKMREWGKGSSQNKKKRSFAVKFWNRLPREALKCFQRFSGSDWAKPGQICSKFRAEPTLNRRLD